MSSRGWFGDACASQRPLRMRTDCASLVTWLTLRAQGARHAGAVDGLYDVAEVVGPAGSCAVHLGLHSSVTVQVILVKELLVFRHPGTGRCARSAGSG